MNLSLRNISSYRICFRRWSNTSYAIFRSIGKVIHIGFLSKIIHGLSTVKSISIYTLKELTTQFGIILGVDEGFDLADRVEELLVIRKLELVKNVFQQKPITNSLDINYFSYIVHERPFYGPFFVCWVFQIKLF